MLIEDNILTTLLYGFIIVAIITYVVSKLFKINSILSFIILFILFIVLVNFRPFIKVITDKDNQIKATNYLLIGNTSYTLSNGKILLLNSSEINDNGGNAIINDTTKSFKTHEVKYGEPAKIYNYKPILCEPYNINYYDYFIDFLNTNPIPNRLDNSRHKIFLSQIVQGTIENEEYKYEGQLLANEIFDGKGTYFWPNGDKYIGDFVDGKFEGKGKEVWVNGDIYEGTYLKDQRHGKGIYYYNNGKSENREYNHGKRIDK